MAQRTLKFAPMRIVVRKGSKAAKWYKKQEGVNPNALVGGLGPTLSHDLVFRGGKVIPNLSFANFYVAGTSHWKKSDMDNIDHALDKAMSDKNLNNVMLQYFSTKKITSTFLGSHTLDGSVPPLFSQGDAEALVKNLSKQGALKNMDLSSTVVNFMLPSGTILTTDELPSTARASVVRSRTGKKSGRKSPAIPVEDEASSEEGLGGYHGSVHLTMSGVSSNATIYYAVGVYSEKGPSGVENGIAAFDQPWKNIVGTFYHELNEARTDPDVEDAIRTNQNAFLGWTSKQGEEVGDFPLDASAGAIKLLFKEVPLADGSGTVPVQFMYSNAVHGPEGPIPNPH